MVILVDSLIVGGVRFVLDKLVQAVDKELNDDTHLRERLLDAQMRLELGEITEDEFAALESEVLARLREIRERRQGAAVTVDPRRYKVVGASASFVGDEHQPEEE